MLLNTYYEQVGGGNTLKIFLINYRAITKNGYVYIYVSNQTPNVHVYWDNLQVTHTSSPLLQENGYYPFGGEIRALTTNAGGAANRHKFNAGVELNEFFDIELYETPFRRYDATTGRFTGVDAMAEVTMHLTPYQFGANSPVMYNDPTGLLLSSEYFNGNSVPDQTTNTFSNRYYGQNRFQSKFLEGMTTEEFWNYAVMSFNQSDYNVGGGTFTSKELERLWNSNYGGIWNSKGGSQIYNSHEQAALVTALSMSLAELLEGADGDNTDEKISAISDRFAKALFEGNNPEGIRNDHRQNSFRHIFQVLLYMKAGASPDAIRVNSWLFHERLVGLDKDVNYNGKVFSEQEDADTIVDLLNNEIAFTRYKYIKKYVTPGQPDKNVAEWALDIMKTGFWGLKNEKTATGLQYKVMFIPLNQSIYNEAVRRLKNL